VTTVTATAQLPPSPAPGGQVEGGRGGGPGGGGFGGGGRGAVAGLYVVSSGGMLHNLNLQTGTDWFTPARMLPGSNAKVTGSILVNSVMYVTTTGNCGGVANGVYAMDLTPADPPQPGPDGLPVPPNATPLSTDVKRWESGGGVVGGPALTSDATLYVTTAAAAASATSRSNAVVALEGKTLVEKDYFLGPGPFTTAPVTFQLEGKEFVAAGNGNRIYVLDAASLGGADHKTPLATSPAPENRLVFGATTAPAAQFTIAGLATFEDAGTRWLLAAARPSFTGTSVTTGAGAVFGYKVNSQNGALLLTQAWVTPITFPVTPAVANGVVFALTSSPLTGAGGARTVLHALDVSTGKELWNSGTAITSAASDVGPAVDDGQVYVVTTDGTLWTFGFVVER
jgi:hypothetical protein